MRAPRIFNARIAAESATLWNEPLPQDLDRSTPKRKITPNDSDYDHQPRHRRADRQLYAPLEGRSLRQGRCLPRCLQRVEAAQPRRARRSAQGPRQGAARQQGRARPADDRRSRQADHREPRRSGTVRRDLRLHRRKRPQGTGRRAARPEQCRARDRHLLAHRRGLRHPAVELPRLSGDPLRNRQPDDGQWRAAEARGQLHRQRPEDRGDLRQGRPAGKPVHRAGGRP